MVFAGRRADGLMAVKNTLNQTLTDQQRVERLAQLCEELQAAVDQAGDHRRLLEQVKQTAQELLSDQESKQPSRKKKRQNNDAKYPMDV